MKRTDLARGTVLVACVIGISLLHYLTPLRLAMLHDIFQRLYYIPIILAAYWFGFRGGIGCALLVTFCYAPHILFQWGGHIAMEMEKYLEVILYNVVGGITGMLSQQERSRREQLEETAKGLEDSYRQLRTQSELIIRIEEQLRRAERLSALGELSAILAHEIRNPLASIRGTAEILREDGAAANRDEFLGILVKESDRLNHVVEDFLRMARSEPAIKKECDINYELANMVTLLSAQARGEEVELRFTPGEVPTLSADPEKLRQAFMNVILNGIQASAPGGRVLVTTSYDRQSRSIEIRFSDNGPGIAREAIGKIFEPFFTTKGSGTGLGLSITKKILEGHGGTLEVESTPGEGACFRARLPTET
ncbi:sensor histidine kinase [Citrifermentans bemidjiense Bem]|uniref:histidine kinase n=1 Tax=Citrifermentans bemidjiense (strain ATCC BAA-1014 / DSM 16622 / JCM 12645 / Bem) TaxID=404380 RepID=B5EH12_CITBB|nr:ATP-binding protein [Citrifermentans bemidjiense]ACH38114.1 sensor histidine kinase [Citrifermentans bemidjiense Bem]